MRRRSPTGPLASGEVLAQGLLDLLGGRAIDVYLLARRQPATGPVREDGQVLRNQRFQRRRVFLGVLTSFAEHAFVDVHSDSFHDSSAGGAIGSVKCFPLDYPSWRRAGLRSSGPTRGAPG